jgi:hypothetical protein
MSVIEIILEIIKISVPALIVFFTVHYLFKNYLQGQQQLRRQEIEKEQKSAALPLRMQAYERLSLFCERIALPTLLLRFPPADQNAKAYRLMLLLAIQQEFEHNITQQVYISSQLWEIIKAARDDAVNFISIVSEKVDQGAPASELKQALLNYEAGRETTGLDTALLAIKKEASIYL